MKATPINESELALLCQVFLRYPAIDRIKIYGSRAKGTHEPNADIDLAVWGNLDSRQIGRIESDLDELPLPYKFDVLAFESIKQASLREHIDRVGIRIYPAETRDGNQRAA